VIPSTSQGMPTIASKLPEVRGDERDFPVTAL